MKKTTLVVLLFNFFGFSNLVYGQQYKSYSIINTFAGSGTQAFSGDGAQALNAGLNTPRDVAVDALGNVYIADGVNQRIRKVDAVTKIITTVAGTGAIGFSGDSGLAINAKFNDPAGLALDAAGNLYIADRYNNRIRRIDAVTKIITTVAGNGSMGFLGFGGPATEAPITWPNDMVLDAAGNLYISGQNDAILKVDTAGILHRIAGFQPGYGGDGGKASSFSTKLSHPHGLLLDADGNLVFCDKKNHRIRKIDLNNDSITTIAGTGVPGIIGDGGAAISAQLYLPDDIALDPNGNLVIADLGNHRMRLLDMATGKLYTVAGTGVAGFSGDGGQATAAQLNTPSGMAITSTGLTYIADQENHRIRTFTFPSIIIAPLKFLSFDVKKAGNNAELNWVTADEVNTEFFIIQRSSNGQSGWEDIGVVSAAGNSVANRSYRFTDGQVLEGPNFYRLKQTDLDGKFSYSKLVSVRFSDEVDAAVSVYPNPFSESIKITLNSGKNSYINVDVINVAGQLQIQRTLNVNPGKNAIMINDLKDLKPGLYFIRITGENINVTTKLMKR